MPGLEKADWDGFALRRRASEERGLLRGRGLACYLEVTAPPNPEMGGIRFEPDGRVTMITGTLDYGQGHASAFAQVLVDRLGVPFELIDLVQDDSDKLLVGGGTGRLALDHGEQQGAPRGGGRGDREGPGAGRPSPGGRTHRHHLRARASRIAGTDPGITLLDLAAKVRQTSRLSAPDLPESLDAPLARIAPVGLPNSPHVAEVQIKPGGEVRLDR